ncbi:hypothetical protein [Deinococcus cavernae]|nr:hypothetical protein [Deinococcus cavernae]
MTRKSIVIQVHPFQPLRFAAALPTLTVIISFSRWWGFTVRTSL